MKSNWTEVQDCEALVKLRRTMNDTTTETFRCDLHEVGPNGENVWRKECTYLASPEESAEAQAALDALCAEEKVQA